MSSVEQKPVFRDLSADDHEPQVTEIESLCMNCHANGTTRLLLTRIPHYRDVVLMSFSCEECGFDNNEIQPGGPVAEQGVRWKLNCKEPGDFNRQVVKSDFTRVLIPELDFEIPAQSQKGEITTVEGIIRRAAAGLQQDQKQRSVDHPDVAAQIRSFVKRLENLCIVSLSSPWTLILEDISGNTFIENPYMPSKDPRCKKVYFKRTKEQDHLLGVFTNEEVSGRSETTESDHTENSNGVHEANNVKTTGEASDTGLLSAVDPSQCTYDKLAADEVLQFRTNCPDCNAPADTNMKVTKIPHFKEVVIMATVCDACGHRTNEVKSGSGIEDRGVKFEVRVAGKDDFSRDVLKSETCSMMIPELDVDVGGRALGGRFTTVEGLLQSTMEQLADSPGVTGDAPSINRDGMERFIEKLKEVLDCKRSVTVVLDDAAGNSYVQSLNDDDPSQPDDGLKITFYERSFEQNEELGLNDMKTENY